MNDTLPSTKICEKHENGKLEKYKKCYKISIQINEMTMKNK